MTTLSAFMFISIDGYYKDKTDSMAWHEHTGEGNSFSIEGLSSGNTLLFGRKTYEQMYSFWPTPMAKELYPEVAEGMNSAKKIVVSNTLRSAEWSNTRLIGKKWLEEIKLIKMKENITILGSGSLIPQLVDSNLLDNITLLIDPIALGAGTPIFKNVKSHLNLKLTETRTFANGAMLAFYNLH